MKIILLTILSFLSLWGLSFDELIYKMKLERVLIVLRLKIMAKMMMS